VIYNFEQPRVAQSVGEFLVDINKSLRGHRGRIAGEVTSVKHTYATAIYFSLKDATGDAVLNCVVWRNIYDQNGVAINEGDHIIVTGTPEVYSARGSFSLKVETVEYAGEGALKKAYDTLKLTLTQEGLLGNERKRTLPRYPKKIGVITSRAGVVMQDFSANLGRYGFVVELVDSRVEGKDALHELLAAIATMAKRDIDLLVIMRGGGSLESLQAFNTEAVVRAIAAFPRPVVTGIGHDVDVTLAELVADVGASTPTAVAEVLNESWNTLQQALMVTETRVRFVYHEWLVKTRRVIDREQAEVVRQFLAVQKSATLLYARLYTTVYQSYRELVTQVFIINRSGEQILARLGTEFVTIKNNLRVAEERVMRSVRTVVVAQRALLAAHTKNILRTQDQRIQVSKTAIGALEQRIHTHDPKRPLALGYSLSYREGSLLRRVAAVKPGDTITTVVADGSFTSTIDTVV
jgi:exodeoxyribonuclease VII large subunit